MTCGDKGKKQNFRGKKEVEECDVYSTKRGVSE